MNFWVVICFIDRYVVFISYDVLVLVGVVVWLVLVVGLVFDVFVFVFVLFVCVRCGVVSVSLIGILDCGDWCVVVGM